MSVEDVTEILAIDLLGVIPDDESVVVATNQGEPVVGEDSLAGKCYQNICRRLLGEEVPISDFNHKPGLRSKLSVFFIRTRRSHYECTFCYNCKRQVAKFANY